MNGTNTPKDLSSRIKILELFTLHVLPRNEEWDYAKSFIANSDILDEERREAFLQTLQELQEASEEQETFQEAEEEVFEETEPESPVLSPPVKDEGASRRQSQPQNTIKHQRTSSEVDYGIEEERPNSIRASLLSESPPAASTTVLKDAPLTKLPPKPEPASPAATTKPRSPPASAPIQSVNRSHLSPPAQTPRRPTRKPKPTNQNALFAQARQLFAALSNLARNMAGTLSKNPTSFLRFLLFLLAFFMAFSQKQVRERARRIVGQSWDKVRATIGMGTKVSYI